MQNRSNVLVALGSNQQSFAGNSRDTLKTAISRIARTGAAIRGQSRFFATPCFPVGAGPDFVNAALRLEWAGSAPELLQALHDIESDMGRVRSERWGVRPVDLDLLAFDDLVLPDRATFDHWNGLPLEDQMRTAPPELILPHPRLQDRAFVLVPLVEVAPNWRHPVLGQTVAQMCAALDPADRAEVVPLTEASSPTSDHAE